MIRKIEYGIEIQNGQELIRIEAFGEGMRIQAVPFGQIPKEDWALEIPKTCRTSFETSILIEEQSETQTLCAEISCGGLTCQVHGNHLSFLREGQIILAELPDIPMTRRKARTYHNALGNDGFSAEIAFAAYDDEILHGMGQYRDADYDLKGCVLELAQRNSQITVPFVLSNRGYGLLWNNPAIGSVSFGKNRTQWQVSSTKKIDYWICVADTPAKIIERYTAVTGRAKPIPEHLLGLWQSKLRYRTQDEVLEVAREYKRRGITLSVIVIDERRAHAFHFSRELARLFLVLHK